MHSLHFEVPEMASEFYVGNISGILFEKQESMPAYHRFSTDEWECEDTGSVYAMAKLLVCMCDAANATGKWNFQDPNTVVKSMELLVHQVAAEIHKASIDDVRSN